MGTEWTEEQAQVIASRGQSLLISAAAGSGKTAVLVERILRRILEDAHPVDLDRLLVVTFTNAAAAQLRERIRSAVSLCLEEDPENKAAQRQMPLLSSDHIQTIDRFCREVVLDHFDKIGIDPSFRIADDGETKLLMSDVASEVIEEAYSAGEEDFLDFASCYAPGRDDGALESYILQLYKYSSASPFPEEWRAQCLDAYDRPAAGETWMEAFLARMRMETEDLQRQTERAIGIAEDTDGPCQYLEALRDDREKLEELCSCRSYAEYLVSFSGWKAKTLGRGSGKVPVDPQKQEMVKKIREGVKKGLDVLRKDYFAWTQEEEENRLRKTARFMRVLVGLTDRFEERFSEEKRDRNIADFSDVEHWALKILIDKTQDGCSPSETAGAYADFFEEVYIDEYQDSNPIQELILWSVSREAKGGHNRFMVGDIKQSIYKFRMADPGIFLDKYEHYKTGGDKPGERRIDLHKNFRSRERVLDGVNLIFRQIMRREVGGIEYGEDESLYPGASFAQYPEGTERDIDVPELLLADEGDVPLADSREAAEADVIAARILQLAGRYPVLDKGTYRPARFSDMVILLRSSRNVADVFSKELTDHGIPNRSGANTGYFNTTEVRTILSYLNILDNPRQDIPLAAVLCSPIGGLTDEELARIRILNKEGALYDGILMASRSVQDSLLRQKLIHFLDSLTALRKRVPDTPIHLLLWQILEETGYGELAGAERFGAQKRANLELLADKAIAYEQTSYKGLFHFVRYIERLKKDELDFGEALAAQENENMVRIMTMHGSKGLEFPIVFVSGLGRKFNLRDSGSSLVLHDHLKAGLDYVDPRLRVKIPNLLRRVISDQIKTDSIGEELRILYVAMTRAKEKLILTGYTPDRVKLLAKAGFLRACYQEKLPGPSVRGAANELEWITAALVRHGAEQDFFDEEKWGLPVFVRTEAESLKGSFKIMTGAEILADFEIEGKRKRERTLTLADADPEKVYDPDLARRLNAMLSLSYRYPGHEHMPGKISVSELKMVTYEAEMHRRQLGEEAVLPEELGIVPDISPFSDTRTADSPDIQDIGIPVPAFMRDTAEESGFTGAALGTVYHKILAQYDFTLTPSSAAVRSLLETMVRCDKIQKGEAEAVKEGRILRFLSSDLGKRMSRAAERGTLHREMPFVIRRQADLINPAWDKAETILIQGIIDAYFEEEDGIVLIDYKTDTVKQGEEESLVRRYKTQFSLYTDALEMLLNRRVKETYLYSLRLGKALRADL